LLFKYIILIFFILYLLLLNFILFKKKFFKINTNKIKMKRNLILIISILLFIKSKEQIEEEINWKTIRKNIISYGPTLIITISLNYFDFYLKNIQYFNSITNAINKMSSNETEEVFYEELSIIINELIEMGKENTPKEFKDKLNQLIELLNKLREYYIKNKKAIDDFLNGGEDFIEEQKKIVDDGTVKRERGNYNPDKILNNFKYDLIMIIFIVILLIVLIYIAKNNFDKLILKKKIELQLSSLSGLNENNENNNKNNNNENNLNNNKNDNENNIYKNDINYLNEPLI